MARNPHEFSKTPEPAPRIGAHRVFGRISLRAHERADLIAPGLPPELAFLPAAGFSSEQLLDAVGAAPRTIRPVDALLSEGIIREEAYYRALARHLGCQYYRGEPPFARSFDAIKGLRCGVAPLDSRGEGPRAVIAPRAESVPLLIEASQSGRIRSGSFALTSPQRFACLVRAHHGEAVLDVALGRLPTGLTARHGMTGPQIAAVGAVAAAACFLGVARFDVLQAVASAALWLTFSAALVLRSMASIASNAEVPTPTLADDELPVYTVVVALYRETRVVQDLVNAINAFDYPKNKLDIKLVVERRDLETLGRLVELRLPARYEVIVAPPGEPKTKPRALNIALSSARGELLVVYDAEDAPSPDQLRLAASRFAADKAIDCLQARLAVRNHDESWLSNGIMAQPPQAKAAHRPNRFPKESVNERFIPLALTAFLGLFCCPHKACHLLGKAHGALGFFDWMAYGALAIGAMILAAETGLSQSPSLLQRLPQFFRHPSWGLAQRWI